MPGLQFAVVILNPKDCDILPAMQAREVQYESFEHLMALHVKMGYKVKWINNFNIIESMLQKT